MCRISRKELGHDSDSWRESEGEQRERKVSGLGGEDTILYVLCCAVPGDQPWSDTSVSFSPMGD